MGDRARSGFTVAMTVALLRGSALALAAGGALAQTPLERGRYLVESILGCGNGHTPKSATGVPAMQRNLAGGMSFDIPPFRGTASNITPDRSTGAEINRAITQGISRDGRALQPPMGFAWYARMTEADLDAIVAYLRTVPPVE